MRFVLAAAWFAVSSFGQALPSESQRLLDTARLWAVVEYFHPYLLTRNVDWDKALIHSIPAIRAAGNPQQYNAALSAMLAALQDPATHIVDPAHPASPSPQPINSRQLRLFRTAFSTSFSISENPAPVASVTVDLDSVQAVVRLSEPFTQLPPSSVAETHNPSADPFPPVEQRLFAAIKTWSVIHYFFAYKDLMDEDWDDVFLSHLPKVIQAQDALDYNLTLADLLTHLTDTHTAPHSATLDAYFGATPVGLRFRLLDKFPIVTAVLDPAAAAAGIKPGDILKRVSNESVTDRFRRFVQYIPASTPQRSGFDTIQTVASGPSDSSVELSIENAEGEAHPVQLTRKNNFPAAQRTTGVVEILPGNIGYLDLDRLEESAVPQALQKLLSTRAFILDLRAARAPAARLLASHLSAQTNPAALENMPLILNPDIATNAVAAQTASTFAVQNLPSPVAPLYTGKTIALIDERTIGDAEYAGLLFEAANKTDFAGEPSAGAYSRIAEISVPGGITITYSTADFRHANGGKLQRLGLQPRISAPTTARGLREGRDEALEAARVSLAQ